jgi:uncharacterized protein with HEPN domain
LRWSTLLRLHAQGIIACDFFVAVTATFRLLYVFVVIEHRSRRLIHYNVTAHQSAAWTLLQLREAVGYEERYRFLIHRRDPGVYLEDIEHYAAAAIRFTSGFSLEQYLTDEKTRAAVERVLEICDEAMNSLYRVAPVVAQSIPHARDIVGFRNILAHGYAELDHNKVYDIAITYAPACMRAYQTVMTMANRHTGNSQGCK